MSAPGRRPEPAQGCPSPLMHLGDVDAAFDSVALGVDLGAEGGQAAVGAAFAGAVADLVGFLRDGAGDPPPAQVGAVGAGAVGLVTQCPVRAGAGAAGAQPGDPDTVQHGLELRAVAPLPGGDHDRQGFVALLAGQVHLGGQAAAGAAQPMIGWFGGDPAGRLGLQIPLLRAPAACWCARATVESTLTSQVISPAASARACSPVRICCQVPSRCQREGPQEERGATHEHGKRQGGREQVPS